MDYPPPKEDRDFFFLEWHSVKDKLPDEGVFVLTLDKYDEFRVDYIISFIDGEPYLWAYRLVTDWECVTHWCALPPPPKLR